MFLVTEALNKLQNIWFSTQIKKVNLTVFTIHFQLKAASLVDESACCVQTHSLAVGAEHSEASCSVCWESLHAPGPVVRQRMLAWFAEITVCGQSAPHRDSRTKTILCRRRTS